jgi:PucR family transcriptional regulator, purine catabolism regulatory protein
MDLAIEPGVVFAREPTATSVELIVDLLEYADDEPSLSEVLTRTTERLVAAFRSQRGLALLLTPDVRAIGIPERWSPPGALADILRRLQPWIADAVWVDRAGVRRLNREAIVAVSRTTPSFDQCLWSIYPGDDAVVALVVDVPSLPLEQTIATQDALHRLLGAVVERFQKAERRRRRQLARADQTALVERLRRLNEQAEQHNDALRRLQQIHDQLGDLVLQGRSIEEIARRLSSLIGNPVVVLGSYFNRVAGSTRNGSTDVADRLASLRASPVLGPELARLATERRPVHLAPDPRLGLTDSLLLAPILAGPDLLGYVLVVEAERSFSPLDFQALEQAATVFALELTRERYIDEVERRLRGDFLHDLIAATFDRQTVVARAGRLGHDLALPQLVLVTAIDGRNGVTDSSHRHDVAERTVRLERALRTSLRQRGLMAQSSIVADGVVALIALSQPDTDAVPLRRLVQAIQADLISYLAPDSASIGVGRIRRDPGEVRQGYQEAVQALRGSQRLGITGHLAEYDRLGVERLLTQLLDGQSLARFVDDVLGPLVAYDATHGSDLLLTLETYLRLGCRQRATADELGLHVNSLHYRLQRIQEIGEVDLEDAEVRLNLHLALRSRWVLNATEHQP